MNWLFWIVVAIIVFFAIRGWNRGLLRILYSLISVVLLIGLISYATPYVTSYIKENTGVYTLLQERCTQALKNRGESTIEEKRRNKPVIQKWQVYPFRSMLLLI